MMGVIGAVIAVVVLLTLGFCYRQGWIFGGGRSSSSDGENSSQSSASSAGRKENPLHTAVRSKANPLHRKSESQQQQPPIDSPAMLAKMPPAPTYHSRFNSANNKRLKSHGIFQRNKNENTSNEVEMKDIEAADSEDVEVLDDMSRKSNFLSSTVVANSLAAPRRRPLAQQRSGLENNSTGPLPAAVMISKLRPVPKKEEDDANLYDMYPDDDEAKAELHRVSYSEKIQDGGLLYADDDFDYRRVKSKWRNQEDNVTAAGNIVVPKPPSAVQRFLPWVSTAKKPPAVVVAPPPSGIRSSLASSPTKDADFSGSNPLARPAKDEGGFAGSNPLARPPKEEGGFAGSNPLARRPAADKTRASNVGAGGADRMEDIML